MNKSKAYRQNVQLGRSRYGTLICTNCGQRLAVVINKDYKYLFLVFLCNCGKEVAFQYPITEDPSPDDLYVDIKDGIVKCRRCKKELFYVDERKFVAFAFHIICDCGKEYTKLHRGFAERKV